MAGILTLAERWFEGALFLSLEMTRPFFVDLWVPIDDASKFQSELKTLLADSLDEESYYSQQGALGYKIMEWVHSTYGSQNFEVFNSWIRSILVLEGPDRPGETFWTSISFQLADRFAADASAAEWAVRLMSELVSFARVKRSEFEDKVETAEDEEPGQWDSHLLAIENSSTDAMMTRVSLIGKYNIFLAAWERHASSLQYAQLYQLWGLGKELAKELSMPEQIVFPGVWRFESSQLLRKFADS